MPDPVAEPRASAVDDEFAGAAAGWNLPPLCDASELAEWLEVTLRELDWFADRWSGEAKRDNRRLCHYHYRVLAKRFGQVRLIEAPKPRLKQLQRRILDGILRHVPQHNAVHGFRSGRSILSFAAPHVGQRTVLRIDLQDFFPSVAGTRIGALFRTLGYPDDVARLLAGLCTNAAPADVWQHTKNLECLTQSRQARWRYSQVHLPQGAPTSPMLANLCAHRLDCRLAALAEAAQARYTRYADDLAFSGGESFARCARRFQHHVCATALEEGFDVNFRKTRLMRPGVQQHLAGLVVNQHLNIRRQEFDRLKAILTNCLRQGVALQNRLEHPHFQSHLDGRISFVELVNPARGRRLRKLFTQIAW